MINLIYHFRDSDFMGPLHFKPELIAPCGMNCGVCKRYLAFSHGVPAERGTVIHCQGCRPASKNCYIKRGCPKLRKSQVDFCFECPDLPCANIVNRLEKRYNERYHTSVVKSLLEIKEKGIEQFLKAQEELFRCPSCGDVVSVHDRKCYTCGKTKPANP
jgi:hypothetical protein